MRMLAFAGRNRKELLRDPLTVFFGLGFPLVLLFLLSMLQRNIPVPMFEIERLAPGVAAFGLTFIALFSAQLVSKDRCSALMARLASSPMRPGDFMLGYMLPLIPLAAAQVGICMLAATVLGLEWSGNMLLCLLSLMPAAAMYIAIGLLCGTLLTDRQVGGICGALLTNVCAWLSGIWFDLELLGDGFRGVCDLLPFANAVTAARAALAGEPAAGPLLIVCAYAVGLLALAVAVFRTKMKKGTL